MLLRLEWLVPLHNPLYLQIVSGRTSPRMKELTRRWTAILDGEPYTASSAILS